MEFSRDFIENAIFSVSIYDGFQKEYFDTEYFYELHKILMTENNYEVQMINIIRNINSHNYKQARNDYFFPEFPEDTLMRMRYVTKSLLKGIMATSEMARLSEIEEAKYYWRWQETDQNWYDPTRHHKIVYQEFKKVDTIEDLERFNIYFHDYILCLVFETADIFIKRLSYTIEYLSDDKQIEEACAFGRFNLENFKKELNKLKL